MAQLIKFSLVSRGISQPFLISGRAFHQNPQIDWSTQSVVHLSFVFRQAEEFNYSKAENNVKVGLMWSLGLGPKDVVKRRACVGIFFLHSLINNSLGCPTVTGWTKKRAEKILTLIIWLMVEWLCIFFYPVYEKFVKKKSVYNI